MRGRSIAAPLILILIGVAFLINNLRPELNIWNVFFLYWPFLLILLGLIRLAEVTFDASQGRPLTARPMSWGHIILLILVCSLLGGVASHRYGPFWHWQANGVDFFGDEFDYPVQASGLATGASRLVLDNLRGNLKVTGADVTEVRVEGHKMIKAYNRKAADEADRVTPVTVVMEGDHVVLRQNEATGPRQQRVSDDLDITVPKGMSVDARGRTGDLTISGIEGSVDVSSDHGDVRLEDIGGNAKVDVNHSGLVRAVNLKGTLELQGRGGDVQLDTIAGQVTITGDYSGTMDFKSLAQTLHYESQHTDLQLEKLPGSLTLDLGELHGENLVGTVHLTTQSRDVHLEDFTGPLDVQLDRGDIDLKPGHALVGKMDAHTRNGNIELSLPEQGKFDLRASTAQGDVENEFGTALVSSNEGRSATLRSATAGGQTLTVTTDRGSISVRKSGVEMEKTSLHEDHE